MGGEKKGVMIMMNMNKNKEKIKQDRIDLCIVIHNHHIVTSIRFECRIKLD